MNNTNFAAQASDELMRSEFERQHQGRNLTRHRLRGTYSSPPIAALWNQHKRTAEWFVGRVTTTPAATADAIVYAAIEEARAAFRDIRAIAGDEQSADKACCAVIDMAHNALHRLAAISKRESDE